MINIFTNPKKYLKEIQCIVMSLDKIKSYKGKSYICAWITKLCPANCENCFFKSNMKSKSKIKEETQFTEEGIEKLIQFVNDSNNAYLQLSGGGEPMIRPREICKIIERVETDRIVIVTSGLFANHQSKAKEILNDLYHSLKQRKSSTKLVLRLSIDEYHFKPLGFEALRNIVEEFRRFYRKSENFELQIHTMINDPTLQKFCEYIGECSIVDENNMLLSDNGVVIKIIPKQVRVVFNDGYEILVSCSKLFYSDLKVDLTESNCDYVKQAVKVFDEDMSNSEYGNPSVITNANGLLGLDFWIDYNGNFTTWGNQQWDCLYNLYSDSYKDLVNGTTQNIISYSFLDKGYYYREGIIRSVNPKASIRSKAINLRDYSGAFLLEEDKSKLYYAIRVIQDYLIEGIISYEDIEHLSMELLSVIKTDNSEIKTLYQDSDYDIIAQNFEQKEMTLTDCEMLLSLIKLGHYEFSTVNLSRLVNRFNQQSDKQILCVEEFEIPTGINFYEKLHERISFMKPETLKNLKERQEHQMDNLNQIKIS